MDISIEEKDRRDAVEYAFSICASLLAAPGFSLDGILANT